MLGVLVALKTAEMVRKARKYADPNGPHADVVASAKSKVAQCRDGVATCIDGAGKFVDEQTGGKYTGKINFSVDKAKGLIGSDSGGGSEPEADAPEGSGDAEPEPAAPEGSDDAEPETPPQARSQAQAQAQSQP